MVAVEGNCMSGVAVATIIKSISCGCGQVAGFLVVSGQTAGFDAGAAADPFVGGIDALGEVVVADAVGGQVTAGTENFGIGHGVFFDNG